MAREENQHQESHQRETIHDKFVIVEIGEAKKVNRVRKMCV